jgi:hypothetical protein
VKKLLLLFFILATLTPASAADFSKPLIDADGKPMCIVQTKEDEDCPAGQAATLGRVVRAALYAQFPDEQNLSLDEKLKRGDLAQAITGAGEIKLKAEDIALMKKAVGKAYGPLVVWAAVRELDPPPK